MRTTPAAVRSDKTASPLANIVELAPTVDYIKVAQVLCQANRDMRSHQIVTASADARWTLGESANRRLATLGLMTAGLAHDLGNHLQVVAAAIHMLERSAEQTDRDEIRLCAEGALEALRRANTLSRRILTFSGDHDGVAERIDVDETLIAMVDALHWTAGPGVRLQVELSGEPAAVYCDPAEFENAILNLVVNARDVLPDGGRIVIAVRLDPRTRSVLVAVSDNGPGIEPHVAKRVFEPFFSTKPTPEGAGLGMTLVADFARRAGGEARLESRPGVGTTVILRLPEAASSRGLTETRAAT